MKPIDFRNATFDSLATYIVGQRERVFHAWGTHGPCTTEQLAERSGLSILTLRPRTTELFHLGFVVLCDSQPSALNSQLSRGGRYRMATPEEMASFIAAQRSPQRELALTA